MNKRVLVVFYSQTGQLKNIVESFCYPLAEADVAVEYLTLVPKEKFKFPWTAEQFFNAMPECVLDVPVAIDPIKPLHNHYDLIILGWQPWFLSPSLPVIAAMKDTGLCEVINSTPIITISGCRNMWIQAHERIKDWIAKHKGIHVGSLVLADRNPNLISAVTIQYWLFKGKKDQLLGVFPKPGVSDSDIAKCKFFGSLTLNALFNSNWVDLQQQFINQEGIKAKINLMFIESRAIKLFMIWAKVIIHKANRRLWLKIFRFYLLIALFVLSPIVLLIFHVIIKPFTFKSLIRQKIKVEGVNLRA